MADLSQVQSVGYRRYGMDGSWMRQGLDWWSHVSLANAARGVSMHHLRRGMNMWEGDVKHGRSTLTRVTLLACKRSVALQHNSDG